MFLWMTLLAHYLHAAHVAQDACLDTLIGECIVALCAAVIPTATVTKNVQVDANCTGTLNRIGRAEKTHAAQWLRQPPC